MDFGKINTSTITTPASAMSMDKPIYFGGTAGTSIIATVNKIA